MSLPIDQLLWFADRFFWSLIRVTAFLMIAPPIGSPMVPARVRLLLAVVVAVALVPVHGSVPEIAQFTLMTVMLVAREVLLGLFLGFSAILFFQIFAIAGQFIAMQMGLGFASLVDPSNGLAVAALGQFFMMLAMLAFVTFGGHLVLLEILADSFRVAPIVSAGVVEGTSSPMSSYAMLLVQYLQWVLDSAIKLAMPLVAAMLVVNFTFGVMTRSAPQFNIFSLGFPFMLVLGLWIVWLFMGDWGAAFQALSREFLGFAHALVAQ